MIKRIRSLHAKIKSRKKRILHWLAILILTATLGSIITSTLFSKDEQILKAEKEGKLIVFDLTTGQKVPAKVITDISETATKKAPKKETAEAAKTETPAEPTKKSEVMLVVSNLGLNSVATDKALTLPSEVLMSFSPYGENVTEISQRAKESGHNVLVDLPMQLKDAHESVGNLAMSVENTDFKNRNRFNASVSKITEPSGVVTPPGDIFTLSANFVPVLNLIADNKFFMIYAGDSEDMEAKAKDADVGMLKVDVILDESKDLAKQIADAEALAAKSGFIVVLARNPSPALVDQLGKWVKSIQAKNISLVSSIR